MGGGFAGAFAYFYVAKNHLHFYCQNLEKTKVLGGQNDSNFEFFELWRDSVSDLKFSSFFFDFVALGLGTFVKDF